jgi:hypothetical protein
MEEPPNNAHWYSQPPASLEAITALRAQSGLDLPPAYLAFLERSNGGDGELGIEPGWVSLWPAEEVVGLNRNYQEEQWIPGFFGFGSNGGGELLAFDTRTPHPWKVYMIPFISVDEEEAILVAQDFTTFAQAIGRSHDSAEADNSA